MLKDYLLSTILLLSSSIAAYAQRETARLFEDCGVNGSTTVYDYQNRTWFYTDSADAVVETLPASTFKIVNSLIALETGAVEDEEQVIPHDGTEHKLFGKPYDKWNQDMDMRTAFAYSAIWFYEELAARVGRSKYQDILEEIGYGNGDLSEVQNDFWNQGNFAVSPKNQIEFLVKLFEKNLPFSSQNIRVVKNMMVSDMDDESVWRGKTGWAQKDGKDIGWWVGYVTTNGYVYFFATRIVKDTATENNHFADCRKSITRKILKEHFNCP